VPGRDPLLRRLRAHMVPAWWRDAKLGIFVHWTPASVAGFAPVDADIGALVRSGRRDALAWTPYTEWYENSLRFPQSPVAAHHREVYRDRPYVEFAREWEAGLAQWDPDAWARTFAATGARYVVLVTKHHDGYCLWPTAVPNPNRPGWNCTRDVVGELGEAVRAVGLRFGVYYSGGLDWTFDDRPIGSLADMLAAVPRGAYPDYAEAHVRELIARYRPSVLWNDIAWPAEGKRLWRLFTDYYDAVPDGVLNDRWMPWSPLLASTRYAPVQKLVDAGARRQARRDVGVIPPKPPHFDVRTPEYVVFPGIQRTPWECVRGMDQSFGYNAESRAEHFLTVDELRWSFLDIVAKNGNLLLNVGPGGVDAQIPDEQHALLAGLGSWMDANVSTVRATRPWVVPGATTEDGVDVRYVARDNIVFAFVHQPGASVTFPLAATPMTTVTASNGDPLEWQASARGITVTVPAIGLGPASPLAIAFESVTALG
jgi:alpha-L-fucosidase